MAVNVCLPHSTGRQFHAIQPFTGTSAKTFLLKQFRNGVHFLSFNQISYMIPKKTKHSESKMVDKSEQHFNVFFYI